MQRRNSDVSDLCLPWLVCSAQNCWWKNGFTVQLGLAVFNLLSRNICLHPLEIRFVLAVTLVWNLDKEGFAQWTMTLAACFKSQPHAGAADVVLKVFFFVYSQFGDETPMCHLGKPVPTPWLCAWFHQPWWFVHHCTEGNNKVARLSDIYCSSLNNHSAQGRAG